MTRAAYAPWETAAPTSGRFALVTSVSTQTCAPGQTRPTVDAVRTALTAAQAAALLGTDAGVGALFAVARKLPADC